MILNCAKIKGEKFPDTVLRLNRQTRWFGPADETASPTLSNYQHIIRIVDHRMRTKDIKLKARENGIADRTTDKILSEAAERGDLRNPKFGFYAPRTKAA